LFVALTSKLYEVVNRSITYHPYTEGTVICNILKSNDCQTVRSNKFDINLTLGETKVYIPKSQMQEITLSKFLEK